MGQINGRELQRIYKPARTGDIRHSCLSNIKAQQALLWKPEQPLKAGLEAAYRYTMKGQIRVWKEDEDEQGDDQG